MVKLPGLFNTSKDTDFFLAIDIGSENVKCLAFQVLAADEPVASIIGIGKSRLLHGSTRGGVIIDFDEVLNASRDAISQATGELDMKVSDVIFGVSGELSFGLMTTVRTVRGKQGPISERELEEIYDKTHDAAYTQAQSEILEITGSSDVDIDLITSSVIYTKLDGNFVSKIIGKENQKLEVALFTAFSPSYHTHTLQKLAKKLGLNIVAIGSQMFTLVKSLKYTLGEQLDCVIMDVGGDLTDVGVVFGGGIVATRSLSIGGIHFTNAISKKTDMTYIDAENRKTAYSFGELSEDANLSIQEIVSDVLDVWLSGIEQLFMDFTGVKTFASDVFLVGGGAMLPDVSSHIKNEPWMRSIPFKAVPEFRKLTIEDLAKVDDATGAVNSLEFVLPASLSIIYLEEKGLL